eukprot:3115123-Prymnesium_polylepis.3
MASVSFTIPSEEVSLPSQTSLTAVTIGSSPTRPSSARGVWSSLRLWSSGAPPPTKASHSAWKTRIAADACKKPHSFSSA